MEMSDLYLIKNLYNVNSTDDTQIVQYILFKDQKKKSSVNEEHTNFRLSIKKQRMSWISKIIYCKKVEVMTNSLKNFFNGKAMLNYVLI